MNAGDMPQLAAGKPPRPQPVAELTAAAELTAELTAAGKPAAEPVAEPVAGYTHTAAPLIHYRHIPALDSAFHTDDFPFTLIIYYFRCFLLCFRFFLCFRVLDLFLFSELNKCINEDSSSGRGVSSSHSASVGLSPAGPEINVL